MELGILKIRIKKLGEMAPALADRYAKEFESSRLPILEMIETIKKSQEADTQKLEASFLTKDGDLKKKKGKTPKDIEKDFLEKVGKIDNSTQDMLAVEMRKQEEICNKTIAEISAVIDQVNEYAENIAHKAKEYSTDLVEKYKAEMELLQKQAGQEDNEYKDQDVLRVICPFCMSWQMINPQVSINKCTICNRLIQKPYWMKWEQIDNQIKKQWSAE